MSFSLRSLSRSRCISASTRKADSGFRLHVSRCATYSQAELRVPQGTRPEGSESEVCRGRGVELDWTSKAPGHHLGPALCAVKRARRVEQTRETIRETVAVSEPGEAVPDRRTLQAIAEIAPRVNDGLTVTEMLERERDEARHGRPAPRPVPAPAPFRPEVVPAPVAHEVLPPVKRAPEGPAAG